MNTLALALVAIVLLAILYFVIRRVAFKQPVQQSTGPIGGADQSAPSVPRAGSKDVRNV